MVFWGLLAVTLVVYVLLVAVVGPPMMALANGAAIPDLRATGYDTADLTTLLTTADPGFPDAYAKVSRSWDRAVPILFALSFGYGLWIAGGVWRVLAVVPVLMGAADLAENTLVTRLLLVGPEGLDPAVVAWASTFTLAKWGLLPVSILLLVASFFKRRPETSEV
ncbi:MAG: hypothetical protein CMH11_02615 [Maritimibacter sp.]|nr:hypothetical protein [Maritimibacter sp.]|tara:strand:- start:5320 stop:5814 length:495 start_codon:yes stop_codon:yes gene_type:complete